MGLFNRSKDGIEKKYTMTKTLGSGSFATVKLCVNRKNKDKFAVKIIQKAAMNQEDMDALEVEVQILKDHSKEHPNIVMMEECFDTTKTFYMVMELMKGGELFDRVVEKEKYNEEEAKGAIRQILNALQYCHQHGVVHRDLKPENLLYQTRNDDSALKIADFGLAKIIQADEMMQTACGTPGYVAPEILNGEQYTAAVDLWSMGVITYILLCGFPPFFDDNNAALFATIKKGAYEYPSPYWDCVSAPAKSFIDSLLQVDPKKRLDCAGALAHPWLAGEEKHTASLCGAQAELKKFNLRRKFKNVTQAIAAVNQMNKLMKAHKGLAAAAAAAKAK